MTTRPGTASVDAVGEEAPAARCAIIFWLSAFGAMILFGFGALVAWDSWMTIRGTETDKVAAVTAHDVAGLEKSLDEVRGDVKELLRRTPPK